MSMEVVETIHGKHRIYLIKRETSILGNVKYYVRVRDSNESWGSFNSLARAVQFAKEKG